MYPLPTRSEVEVFRIFLREEGWLTSLDVQQCLSKEDVTIAPRTLRKVLHKLAARDVIESLMVYPAYYYRLRPERCESAYVAKLYAVAEALGISLEGVEHVRES